MLRGSLDRTWGTKGQFIRPRCIRAARSRILDIFVLIYTSINYEASVLKNCFSNMYT
jgi:hypothetical protein